MTWLRECLPKAFSSAVLLLGSSVNKVKLGTPGDLTPALELHSFHDTKSSLTQHFAPRDTGPLQIAAFHSPSPSVPWWPPSPSGVSGPSNKTSLMSQARAGEQLSCFGTSRSLTLTLTLKWDGRVSPSSRKWPHLELGFHK